MAVFSHSVIDTWKHLGPKVVAYISLAAGKVLFDTVRFAEVQVENEKASPVFPRSGWSQSSSLRQTKAQRTVAWAFSATLASPTRRRVPGETIYPRFAGLKLLKLILGMHPTVDIAAVETPFDKGNRSSYMSQGGSASWSFIIIDGCGRFGGLLTGSSGKMGSSDATPFFWLWSRLQSNNGLSDAFHKPVVAYPRPAATST
ncbi:hypothetical protein GALMADRAFT_138194 [Galerina marginata CBS 339.88]|uniref:Uncharacterized protein n=1 Tax=Galerina marginata (strain CBS 339.88) TaxID=685588 RepID=A0A067T4E4_GALM3|nr:hypothetical protein GALMADRAFT_138194 [Galerina marginata CBS 339.88]